MTEPHALNYGVSAEITPELVAALKSGDHRAFGKIYLNYITPLTNFLEILIQDDAEDVAQEVFKYLWENRDKIDSTKSIKGFIFTHAKFLALNTIKHNKVKDKYTNANGSSWDYSKELGLPDENLIEEETRMLINIALERMPQQQQKVFIMSRYKDKSNDEIASELNISKRTVETHLYKALSQLKKLLALIIFFT